MEPLRITVYFLTPPALGHPWIHLDGLLAHLVARRELGERYYLLPSKRVDVDMLRDLMDKVPLKKVGRPLWFFSASVSIMRGRVSGTKIYKKFHAKNAPKTKKRKVETKRGPFRSFMMTLPYIVTDRAVFYAVGEKEEVEQLLRHVAGLGKKRVVGFGAVRKFEVEEIDEDRSIVCDGVVVRPVPLASIKKMEGDSISLATSPYRPPYWSKDVAVCVMPFSRVTTLEVRE